MTDPCAQYALGNSSDRGKRDEAVSVRVKTNHREGISFARRVANLVFRRRIFESIDDRLTSN